MKKYSMDTFSEYSGSGVLRLRGILEYSGKVGMSSKESATRLLHVPLVHYPEVCVCHSCSETWASFCGRVVQRQRYPEFLSVLLASAGVSPNDSATLITSGCISCCETCASFCGRVVQRKRYPEFFLYLSLLRACRPKTALP